MGGCQASNIKNIEDTEIPLSRRLSKADNESKIKLDFEKGNCSILQNNLYCVGPNFRSGTNDHVSTIRRQVYINNDNKIPTNMNFERDESYRDGSQWKVEDSLLSFELGAFISKNGGINVKIPQLQKPEKSSILTRRNRSSENVAGISKNTIDTPKSDVGFPNHSRKITPICPIIGQSNFTKKM